MIPGVELGLLLALWACKGAPPGEQARPQSRPVAPPQAAEVPGAVVGVGGGPVDHPVLLAELRQAWPELAGLDAVPGLVVEGVLNLEPAPCLPCEEQDLSMARCALAPPPGCENVAELVARAARVAQAGGSPAAVKAVVTLAEPWTPTPGAGSPAWPSPGAPVQVELWVDPSRGPWREAVGRAQELVALGAADAQVGPLAVQVRLLPSWARVEDGAPPPGALALHQALAAADSLGQGLPFAAALAAAMPDGAPTIDLAALQALAAGIGLDPASFQTALAGTAPARLRLDQQAAAEIGLRAAPSWRVDGYRLRGHRSLENLRDVVENQQLDHLAALPPALLAPWDPAQATLSPTSPAGSARP